MWAGDAATRWRGDERPSGSAVTSSRLPRPTNSARYAEARAKTQVTHPDSLTGRARAYAGRARRPPTQSRHDEPAAGLNPRETAALNALLRSIRDEYSTSILLIEHDMSVVMEISDHVVVLEYGCKISDGTPEHVRNDARVIAAYLGVEDEEVEKVEAEITR